MKNILTIVCLLVTFLTVAQTDLNNRERNTQFALIVTQDGILSFKKDNAGNTPFTTDVTLKVEVRGFSTKTGYFSGIPIFEYADLKGGEYFSYGVAVGYTSDEWLYIPTFRILNNDLDLDVTPYVGLNKIKRKWADTDHTSTWSNFKVGVIAGTQFTVKIHKNIGFLLDFKFVDRQDLKYKYDNFNEAMSFNLAYGIQFEF